ncbi:iron complex outermembrane recepter protein [Pseudoxanthomonas sp. GM95]|uniref:TonB-dependent siderophore receptor n=1 Tax=Pseudoxanthomonas sp. GM95 TaxID=1881043 RepID=UPI0008D6503E|nr:TonB-dependent siderophore receptor [Pseudoxanthomonas sp. GM95]SEK85191.1 iron complex outermembrane recepter protein [Pseudoxanthomonas sp. GM95]
MNRPRSTLLLSSLLCTALPLHAQQVDDTQTSADSTATELAAVRVQGQADDRPRAPDAQLGSFGPGRWKDTPASINVLDRTLLDKRQPRSLSEVAYSDASLGDSYAAVGYYQNVAIRGFPLDLATGYRFNDLTIAGEQRLALENIQQVEILKGEAGLTAGIMAPGGIINYVAKRPARVQELTVGTDSHGSRYTAVDLGRWITSTFGLRFNAAWEDTHSYIDHTDGRRNFYALAADWLIGDKGKLELDGNYQTSAQRSASGYQLLGGDTLPTHASATTLLGYQPWSQPVAIQSTNLTARYRYQFNDAWQGSVALGHSRSVIDDNVAFAYGCFYAAQCADGSVPGNYFAPNGDYDVYDYRSPDDTRVNDEVRAQLQGRFTTGALSHQLTVGVDGFRRTVDRRQDVYDYVGTANIHDATVPVFAPSPNAPGASARRLDDKQRAVFALDRINFGNGWQWLAGGRFVKLDEIANDSDGVRERRTQLSKFLPQTALMWQATDRLNTYVSYSKGLSLGQEAPYWTSNADSFLPPLLSRQVELGAKFSATSSLDLGAALFRISQPFQYAMPDDSDAGYTFIQRGNQVHTGLELSANGKLSEHVHVTASASVLRARAEDAGTPAYEGHQLINIPKARASVLVDYQLPFAPAWTVSGGWRYAASNVATPDGSTKVPSYNVFDAGLRVRSEVRGHALTWRLSVDNVFDKFYWRDTGSSGGDYYLFPGAPRLARLTVSYAL